MSERTTRSSLSALGPYLRRYPLRLAAGLLANLGASAVGLAAPLLIGRAVDAFRAQVSSRTLLTYAVVLLGITAVQGVFSFAQRTILVTLSRNVELDLRDDYFRHLQRLPLSFFQSRHTGDLMARGTNDLQAVRLLCGPAIMYTANTVFGAAGALYFMARIHPPMTLVALGTMPVVAFATKYFGQRIHTLFQRVQEQFASLSTRVQESLAGVRVVRAYAREDSEVRSFDEINHEYVDRSRRLIRWNSAFRPLLQMLVGVGFVGVLWLGGRLVAREAITVGEFVTFNFFLSRLVWPMIAIGWVINIVQRGTASLGRILEVLQTVPEIESSSGPEARERSLEGAVQFRSLTFAYDRDPVLRDVDVEVPPGTLVALVGRTGSGKSTLLSLIPRLIDPPPGALLLDGVDVRDWSLEALRRGIGVVPQETFLFSMSVAENIALGVPEAERTAIEHTAELAGLTDDVAEFPQGLDTLVGERGITLSGGQKQRVALARALLRNPRVLLLDDCLSAVDTATEEKILRNLRAELRRRTVFLVSHRISTVRGADVVLVLEDGRVTQSGSHEDLLRQPGLYAELERRQRLEEELAYA